MVGVTVPYFIRIFSFSLALSASPLPLNPPAEKKEVAYGSSPAQTSNTGET